MYYTITWLDTMKPGDVHEDDCGSEQYYHLTSQFGHDAFDYGVNSMGPADKNTRLRGISTRSPATRDCDLVNCPFGKGKQFYPHKKVPPGFYSTRWQPRLSLQIPAFLRARPTRAIHRSPSSRSFGSVQAPCHPHHTPDLIIGVYESQFVVGPRFHPVAAYSRFR